MDDGAADSVGKSNYSIRRVRKKPAFHDDFAYNVENRKKNRKGLKRPKPIRPEPAEPSKTVPIQPPNLISKGFLRSCAISCYPSPSFQRKRKRWNSSKELH